MCNIPNPNYNYVGDNFGRRFNRGRADGSLVGGEIGLAAANIKHYRQDVAAARADGVITPWERMGLRAERNAVSHLIYDLRHNGFGNQPAPRPQPLPCPITDPWPNVRVGPQPAVDPFHPFASR